MAGVTLEEVRTAAASLTGELLQVPPMVSAIKVGGRRLHELARAGVEIDRPPRPVTVHHFGVEATADPLVFTIEVTCSPGTYIRSLAADLGRLLGGGAHLRALRRTAVGSFTLDEAVPVETLTPDGLLPVGAAVRDLASVELDPVLAGPVAQGRVLERADRFVGAGPWAVTVGGRLVAVYEAHRGSTVKPAVVLAGGGKG
jgi:tRNA pseudouridine55 synthase